MSTNYTTFHTYTTEEIAELARTHLQQRTGKGEKKNYYDCPICNGKLYVAPNNQKVSCLSGKGDESHKGQLFKAILQQSGEWKDHEKNEKPIPQPIKNGEGLTKEHYAEFKKSGIPEEIADLNFAGVKDPATIADFLGWEWYKNGPGWVVRSWGNNKGQFKADVAFQLPAWKKKGKYINGGTGVDAMLLNYPSVDWELVANDPSIPIVITEGAKKALSVMHHKFSFPSDDSLAGIETIPAIAIMGVSMWHIKDDDTKFVENLEKFVRDGRPILLAYDSDYRKNPDVKRELKLIGQRLSERKCNVYVWDWPIEHKGIDDLLVEGTDNRIAKSTYEQWLAVDKKVEKKQVADIAKEKSGKAPSQSAVVKDLVDQYKDKKHQLMYLSPLKRWYSCEGGIWVKRTDDVIRRDVICSYLDVRDIEYSSDYLNGIMKILSTKLSVDTIDKIDGKLPFKNGCLNLSTMLLEPHRESNYLTWCLPYDYDPNATCEPIHAWFNSVVDHEDQVQLLRAYLAAIVRGRSDLQKFLQIQGDPGTGKSVYMTLAQALVGKQNTCTTTLDRLQDNQFEIPRLYEKKLILIADSGSHGKGLDVLKNITGEDDLPFEMKNIQSDASVAIEGMVLITCNRPIQSTDKSSALDRRRIVVRFDHVVRDEDKGRIQPIKINKDGSVSGTFAPYLPGLMNWVLEMPDDTVSDYLRLTRKFVPSLEATALQAISEKDPMALWFDQALILNKDKETSVGSAIREKTVDNPKSFMHTDKWLYPNYKEYCVTHGYQAVGHNNFTDNLVDLLNNAYKVGFIKKTKTNKGRFIKGVTLRPDYDDYTPLLFTGPDSQLKTINGAISDDTVVASDDTVVAESIGSGGCEARDGCLNIEKEENKINKIKKIKRVEGSTLFLPSQPPQPPLPSVPAVTDTVTLPSPNPEPVTFPTGQGLEDDLPSNNSEIAVTNPSPNEAGHTLDIGLTFGNYTPLKNESEYISKVTTVMTTWGPYEFSHEVAGNTGPVRIYLNKKQNRQIWLDVNNPGHCEKPYPLE